MVVQKFDTVQLRELSLQYKTGSNSVYSVPCVGSLNGEPELRTITKSCAGVESDSVTIPVKLNLTLTGHLDIDVAREYFGLTNEGLKDGVYAYDRKTVTGEFTLAGIVVDIFQLDEDTGLPLRKLIAFPRVKSASGLNISIDNNSDDFAEIELTMTAYFDTNDKAYYEVITSEVTDQTVITDWMSAWTPQLMQADGVTPVED